MGQCRPRQHSTIGPARPGRPLGPPVFCRGHLLAGAPGPLEQLLAGASGPPGSSSPGRRAPPRWFARGALPGEEEAGRGETVSAVQQPDAGLIVLVAGDQAGLLAGQDGAVVLEFGGRGGGGEPGQNVLDRGPVDGVVHVARRVDVGGPQRPGLARLPPWRPRARRRSRRERPPQRPSGWSCSHDPPGRCRRPAAATAGPALAAAARDVTGVPTPAARRRRARTGGGRPAPAGRDAPPPA